MQLPQCQRCGRGVLVPLSDYGPRGSSLMYKLWVCINPDCGLTIRVDKGVIQYVARVERRSAGSQQAARSP